jgi:hypothetical protein
VPIAVEVNLKIPSLTIRPADAPAKRVDNQSLRFTKRIEVPAIPKTGDLLQVTAGALEPFDCTVTRAGWSEEKEMFIVSCTYAKRAITPETYGALVNDPAWVVAVLP